MACGQTRLVDAFPLKLAAQIGRKRSRVIANEIASQNTAEANLVVCSTSTNFQDLTDACAHLSDRASSEEIK
jgi:hypothetical protein